MTWRSITRSDLFWVESLWRKHAVECAMNSFSFQGKPQDRVAQVGQASGHYRSCILSTSKLRAACIKHLSGGPGEVLG